MPYDEFAASEALDATSLSDAWGFDVPPATLRSVGAILKGIAKSEPYRYYLHGIHVEQAADGQAVAVATNGHLMHIGSWTPDEPIVKPIRIPLCCIPTIGGARASRAKSERTRVSVSGEYVRTETHVDAKTILQAGVQPEGRFPDWRRVFCVPTDDEHANAMHACYNVPYLKVVTEAARLAAIETIIFRMGRGRGCSRSPTLWHGESPYGGGLWIMHMPVRWDDDGKIAWEVPAAPA